MNQFSDKVWWTKKARIKTERRLLKFDFYSQLLLIWYSFFLVAYSIFSLVNPANGNNESAVMISLSVLVLVMTLFINSMNLKGRAMLIKQCYEQLSVIYTRAKIETDIIELDKEYQKVLSISENHNEYDFSCALIDEYNNTEDKSKLSKQPTKSQIKTRRNIKIINYLILISSFIFPVFVVFFLRMI
ncbi:SLATT domain-containing protein [Proteus vulgaris]|nr:SLATT domain-containing protein [Proteus vulgaris]